MKVTLRQKKLKNNKKSLYLDYYQNGKREYEFLGMILTGDPNNDKLLLEQAEKIRIKRQYEVNKEKYDFRETKGSKIQFLEYFERVRATKTQALGVWRTAFYHLKNFIKDENLKISDINTLWLEEFKSYLLSKIAPNSAKVLFSCVRNVLKQALKDEIIEKNPADKVSNISNHFNQRSYLDFDEVKKLSETACSNDEVKRAFLFCCFTGLRISDVRALKWSNIKKDHIELTQKKTKEPVYIPLHNTALKLLGERKSPETNVFKIPSHTHLSLIINTWVKQSGINKHITFHSSRHTFATLGLTYGIDIYTISKLLGHSNLETTQVYAKIIDEKKKQSIKLLPSIEI